MTLNYGKISGKMLSKGEITVQELLDNEGLFKNLSEFSLEDIRAIWYQNGDKIVEDLTSINSDNYDWRDPLYVKMIHRFNNCRKNPFVFWWQIDPCNQGIMLRRYTKTLLFYNSKIFVLAEFFAWMSNSLNYMFPVKHFYEELENEGRVDLVERFNKECIVEYNQIMETEVP